MTVLDYLEQTEKRFPDKTAVIDENTECTYRNLANRARLVASVLAAYTEPRRPVAVFMDKSVETLTYFIGITCAGGFYVLIDPSFPAERVRQILAVLGPAVVITKEAHREKLEKDAGFTGTVLTADSFAGKKMTDCDKETLRRIREDMTDTDPLYCNFTSGSTGTPKGVLVCHRSVIDFIDCFTDIFGITEQDVLGNQAPFDFDVSVKDIYSCMKTGATLVLIPRSYFMFPNQVVDMLEQHGVTTLIWAVSALCLLNRLHGLRHRAPSKINKILFSGEQMPVKQLNQWRRYYPDAMFVNLYGPTEITCNCLYYIIDREFGEEERLPLGRAFPNERVFLLDEADGRVTAGQPGCRGEICVAGTALALGYYNNPVMTDKAFVQNPLNRLYPEILYRTGDLAAYGEDGNLYFAGRKDFQIKHMGHRIELEEIDSALNSVEAVEQGCCFFDEEKNRIAAVYSGTAAPKDIMEAMKSRVPVFMIPNVFWQIDELPLTKNGKIDRAFLKSRYRQERGAVSHG